MDDQKAFEGALDSRLGMHERFGSGDIRGDIRCCAFMRPNEYYRSPWTIPKDHYVFGLLLTIQDDRYVFV